MLVLSSGTVAGMTEVHTGAGLDKLKPNCIAMYNKYMGGGIDLSDRKICHVSAERHSK